MRFNFKLQLLFNQRWSPGNNLLGQGKGLQKKSEAKAKDLLVKDRPSRGQSHGPGTQFF